jgi:hypothetical protein
MTAAVLTRPAATATATATATAYCPTCRTDKPAAAFERLRLPVADDLFGSSVRCNACLADDARAERFVSANRRAAKADPFSPLAAAYRLVRQSRHEAMRTARAYYLATVREPATA